MDYYGVLTCYLRFHSGRCYDGFMDRYELLRALYLYLRVLYE